MNRFHSARLPSPRSADRYLAATLVAMALSGCGGGGGGSSDNVDNPSGGGGGGGGTTLVPAASLDAVRSDTLTQPGAVLSGGRTDDNTPQLSGRLDAALADGQVLKVFDGDTVLAAPTVSGRDWTLALVNPLADGEHRFSAQVVAADGQTGTRSAVFTVTVAQVAWQGISPSQVVRATPSTLHLTGSGWPASGWSVEPTDDAAAHCDAPSAVSDTALDVQCQFHLPGVRQLVLKLNGQTVAEPSVTVASNVSGVTWSSPSTGGFGMRTVTAGETVQFKVSGTQLKADAVLAMTVAGCTAAPTETGTPSQTERLFSCTIDLATPAGNQAGALHATDASGPQLAAWQLPVAVQPVTAPEPKLPHTGITANQCYSTSGGITLGACSAADAIALNGQQDGHRVGVQTMSFSRVGSHGLDECVKDNRTGLVWEGKTVTGQRSADSNMHFGTGTSPGANIWAKDDYIAETNRVGLCGFSDWRLPTAEEMRSIIDYGISTTGVALAPAWFVNSSRTGFHWTGTVDATGRYRWVMDMATGSQVYEPEFNADGAGYLHRVRLVRGGS